MRLMHMSGNGQEAAQKVCVLKQRPVPVINGGAREYMHDATQRQNQRTAILMRKG